MAVFTPASFEVTFVGFPEVPISRLKRGRRIAQGIKRGANHANV